MRDGGFIDPERRGRLRLDGGPCGGEQTVGRGRGCPPTPCRLSVDALLVRRPGHLVPAGYRVSGLPTTARCRRAWPMAGVSPGQITDVLITHGHFDHVGGLVTRRWPVRPSLRPRSTYPRGMGVDARPGARRRALAVAHCTTGQTFEPGGDLSCRGSPRSRSMVIRQGMSATRSSPGARGSMTSAMPRTARSSRSSGPIGPAAWIWTGRWRRASRRRTLEHLPLATASWSSRRIFHSLVSGEFKPRADGFVWKPLALGAR